MKINFRKIASVLTGAVMLSSTVAFAAAANFPAPFVKSGAGDYAVVYGSTAVAGTDNVAAADINAFLSGKVTTTSAPVTGDLSLSDGDVVQLEKTSDKFNLGDGSASLETKLDSKDLPVVLESATYYNDASEDFDYDQEITLANLTLSFNQDNKFNDKKPYVGFDIASGQSILNYTLDFDNAAEANGAWGTDANDFQGSVIKLLGREYYISDTSNSSGGSLTLLDTANSVRILEGESQNIPVGDKNYEVKVLAVSDDNPDTVSLSVNGVEITTDLAEGDTAKVKGEDVYVGVKRISTSSKESVANSAVVTIGTGQLVLTNGQEVELNGEALSTYDEYENQKLNAYFTRSFDDLDKIVLEWKSNSDKNWMMPGSSITMPGFGAIKLSMGNFVTPTAEETSFEDDDDSLKVSTMVEDGAVDFSMFYGNDTSITGLGRSSDEQMKTSFNSGAVSVASGAELNLTLVDAQDTIFAATWISGDEAETYVYQLDSVSGVDNETTLTNLAEDGDDIDLTKTGEDDSNDRMTFTLEHAVKDVNATISIAPTSGTVYLDRVVTKGGLMFKLPTGPDYASNGNKTSFAINFTEANADSDDIGAGVSFIATGSPSEDGAEISSVTEGASLNLYPQESNSDISIGYVVSDLASYVEYNDVDSGAATLRVDYHPTESYAQVYVTESTVSFNEDGSSSGGSSGTVLVTDSEVSKVQSKNLIVVGGSCVNTVAATLLGSDVPLCGDDWAAKTNAGSGAFLIETYANPWSTGKVATLVAGYDATDTTNAVNALKTETIDSTVGMKYVKLAGSTLQLV